MNSLVFERDLFGGKIQLIVYNPPENAKEILEEFYEEALRLQKIFNFFDKESELSALNKKRQLKVSKDLLKVLRESLKFAKLTNGRYDPTLGKKILQRKSNQNESKLSCSYKDINIILNKITLKNPDAIIDLGSIAKGYITDKLAEFLRSRNVENFIINSRGDIVFSGNAEHIIGIKNPRKPNETLLKIKLKNLAVATSGDYNQFYGDFKKSHILNSNDAISITVVSGKLEDADVLATALFVSNASERKNLISKFPKSKIMILKENQKVPFKSDAYLRENLKPEFYNNFEDIVEK